MIILESASPRPWTWWEALLDAAAIYFLALILSHVASTFAVMLIFLGLFPGLQTWDVDWAFYLSSWAIWPIIELSLLAAIAMRRRMFDQVFNFGRPVTSWFATCGLIIAALALIAFIGFSGWLWFPASGQEEREIFTYLVSSPMAWLTFLLAVVIGPIVEEVIYRGFLLPVFTNTRLGFWGAASFVSLGWSAVHFRDLPQSAMIFATGIVLSLLARKTGSLWPCVIAHSLVNAASLLEIWAFAGQS